MVRYADLQVTSNFSFLRGASHAEELAMRAAELGHVAFAMTDRNTLAGVVRGHLAARTSGLRLVVGCRLDLQDGPSLLAYPTDRAAYGRLARLLTQGNRRAVKGDCRLWQADVRDHAQGMLFIAVPTTDLVAFGPALLRYRAWFGDQLSLAACHRAQGDDARRLAALAALAKHSRVPLVATNDVLYHVPARRPLQDIMTCIRHHCRIDDAGFRLAANADRHVKAPAEMARLFHAYPDAVARTADLVALCRFELDDLRYEYPEEITTDGRTPHQELEYLTWEGAARRYPNGAPEDVRRTIGHELALIDRLGYAPYFLTVHDIVRFARSRNILCQGRGSAANSAVCYCLGITAVDPARTDLLFERFVSEARNEPPDIDVDFEHERREEVIQYVYEKYGRDRAGIAATVIRYRTRGAIREVGKAMGLSADTVSRLSGAIWGWGKDGLTADRVQELGLDADEPRLAQTLALTRELIGFPRHLSQHVGGFVITKGALSELCPIMNAAMPARTTIEWDKDDIDALGILKVDVLALGMLTCLRKGLALLARHHGTTYGLATVPAEDPAVYDMLCRADSLGVFQVESRAQMTMLPRLRPRSFYDLVIEVAIVRPGPIQGDMVHPYLQRRSGAEKIDYPSEDLRQVLDKTLGVPLFQEQAMKIAIVAAGFTPCEADQLRRAMATFRNVGTIHTFRDKLVDGMTARGYDRDFAERCFKQIEGFGTYGFPESHAASFALLVYVSAWLKCHHPEAFACALLNSQPMGFYAPAQIVRDAQEHGVQVLPPDVNHADWDCTLEPPEPTQTRTASQRLCLRLGFRQIKGLARSQAERLIAARHPPFRSIEALWRASRIEATALECLAQADAFASLGLSRRKALWHAKALGAEPLPLFAGLTDPEVSEPDVVLPTMTLGEEVVEDYGSLSLSLKRHPVALLRDTLAGFAIVPTERLRRAGNGSQLTTAGLVLVRQRPGTAKGILFITVEDETGVANLVVMPPVFERHRREILTARLLAAHGTVEKKDAVIHLKAIRFMDLSHRLASLSASADPAMATSLRAMPTALAHADEVSRPVEDHRGEHTRSLRAFPDGRNFH